MPALSARDNSLVLEADSPDAAATAAAETLADVFTDFDIGLSDSPTCTAAVPEPSMGGLFAEENQNSGMFNLFPLEDSPHEPPPAAPEAEVAVSRKSTKRHRQTKSDPEGVRLASESLLGEPPWGEHLLLPTAAQVPLPPDPVISELFGLVPEPGPASKRNKTSRPRSKSLEDGGGAANSEAQQQVAASAGGTAAAAAKPFAKELAEAKAAKQAAARAAKAADRAKAKAAAAAGDRTAARGKYRCSRCGQPKEGHVCDLFVQVRSVQTQVDLDITNATKHRCLSALQPVWAQAQATCRTELREAALAGVGGGGGGGGSGASGSAVPHGQTLSVAA
jgi:ribosomal protein S14